MVRRAASSETRKSLAKKSSGVRMVYSLRCEFVLNLAFILGSGDIHLTLIQMLWPLPELRMPRQDDRKQPPYPVKSRELEYLLSGPST
jgi:hypothetical protein